MTKKIIYFVLVLALSLILFNCVVEVSPTYEPPPPRHEDRMDRPGHNFIWIEGHYEWRHDNWHWVNGYWVKEKRGHDWVPGHWDKRGRNWVWIKGHWRKR